MSYAPTTDFLALLRLASDGVHTERMPGLDYVVAAMARAGLFTLSVGQTAPTVNQPMTVWLQPALPSWTAEGTVFLWNAATGAYALATAGLWAALLAPNGYAFQSAAIANNIVNVGTTILAVQRAAPAATSLLLPNLAAQFATGRPLKIVDWSTGVANHTITITTPDGSTIMKLASLQLLSTAAQLAGIMLHASPDLNGWIIAP